MIGRGNKTYYDMVTTYQNGGAALPGAGSASIYVCPSATPAAGPKTSYVDNGYFDMFGLPPGSLPGATPVKLPTYWCYVYNCGITNFYSNSANILGVHQFIDAFGTPHMKAALFVPASEVVIMCEHMMSPGEVANIIAPISGQTVPTQLNTGKTEARVNKASQTILSARHHAGGHLLFIDGHVGFERYIDAITKNPDTVGKGGNRPGIIWEPGYQMF
jgi:hypothetical protein